MISRLAVFDETAARQRRAAVLVGIDEAGRGPLAGPVVACACIIAPELYPVLGEVNDSKKLSPKKREELFDLLKTSGAACGLGFCGPEEIDRINILQATFAAMRAAVAQLCPPPGAFALVDGNNAIPGLELPQTPVIKGDGKSLAVAAASIIAKVTRDRLLCGLDAKYPGYGFAKHKGYGTAEHIAAIEKLGPCPEHRRTFLPDKLPFYA
ncbi:MAG: ribonuclease HII [Elusimicrobiales bacterium]